MLPLNSEKQRASIYARFLAHLGADADRRLDSLTADTCRAWVRIQLDRVSLGTVESYLSYLSAAFNRAIDDALLERNPFSRLAVGEMSRAANPTAAQDKTDREPFTAEELRLLCTAIAQPWRDMVLISFLTGGQRIGDIACLKWESVNREAKTITFITGKTRKLISHPMIKPLHDSSSRTSPASCGS